MPTPTSNPELPAVRERSFAFAPRLDRTRRAIQALDQQAGLRAPWLIASFLLAALLIFLRGPSFFTHAQFWAEDGKVWYAQAYNGGWLHSLTQPDGGYLNTLQRIAGGLALHVPFRWAPLIMALYGLFFQALPVPILLSARSRNWAPLTFRLLFALVYIAIPDAREIHVLCTNSHFHLAVVEVLLAFAAAPKSLSGRIFDVVTLALATVCGPFALVLLPFLFAFWFLRRQRWSLVLFCVLASGSVIQLALLLNYKTARSYRFLGATVARFIRILGGDVFIGALRGSTPYGHKQPLFVCLIALLIGLALIVYCFRRSSLEVRLFCLYCFTLFAACLRSPLIPPTPLPLWEAILQEASLRYWFFPSLIFLWALIWCVCYARSFLFRGVAVLLTAMLIRGMVRDWRIPALVDLHFPEYAAQFEAAPAGSHVTIPLNPPPAWSMEITKK